MVALDGSNAKSFLLLMVSLGRSLARSDESLYQSLGCEFSR